MRQERFFVYIFAIIFLLSIFLCMQFSYKNTGKNITYKRKIVTVSVFYNKFVITNKDTHLYKLDGIIQTVGTVKEGSSLILDGIYHNYFKIKDTNYYVYFEDVIKTKDFEVFDDYSNRVKVNGKLTLDGIIINEEVSLSMKREVNDYYVIFNNQKFIINSEENVFNTYEQAANSIPVLTYHFFKDDNYGNIITVKNTDFYEQMKYLYDNNYYNPTTKELEQYIDGTKTLPKKSVIITIDDGAYSVYKYAYPILKKFNIRAILYIITSYVKDYDETKEKSWFISSKMYEEMKSSPNIYLNSHTSNMHAESANSTIVRIDRGNYNDVVVDLKESINFLGNSESFCYPFGIYNNQAMNAVKEAGFPIAFTTNVGNVYVGDNKLELNRQYINRGTPLKTFIKKVSN